MKINRKNNQRFKPDLILTADWHLMEKERQPPCRVDNYWNAQWNKVTQILKLQDKYKCPIYIAGDIFEHWKTSPSLLNKCIRILKGRDIFSIIGNHDMPQHNIDFMNKSGLETLFSAGVIKKMYNQIDWGRGLEEFNPIQILNRKILVAHIMVWKGVLPWPSCSDPKATDFLKTTKGPDLILTGHNHKTFVSKKDERLLINPGSITRHKADQLDHRPCVFLWSGKDNTYKKHYLKIDKKVVSREHIEKKKEKEDRSQAFIATLKKRWNIGFSFADNVQLRLKENNITHGVKKYVLKWIDPEG